MASPLFAEGRRLEAEGRYAEAFAAFAEANRQARPADAETILEATERQVEALVAVWTLGFIAANVSASGCERPIFIVGMPRSGSTLVEQILASHPHVTALGETNAMIGAVQSGAQELNALRCAYLTQAPLGGFTDKLLSNFARVGLIHLMFPKAPILHVVRDPLDCCLSCYTSPFGSPHLGWAFDLGDIARYYRAYRTLMAHWEAVLPGRLVTVNYERLVEDFDAEARALVKAAKLPWSDACLRFHETERPISTLSADQVRRPIYRDAIGRAGRFGLHKLT